jgi:alpha-galactosidase
MYEGVMSKYRLLQVATLSAIALAFLSPASAEITAHQSGAKVSLSNGIVTFTYDRKSGLSEIAWGDAHKISGIYSAAQLSGQNLESTTYSEHSFDAKPQLVKGGPVEGEIYTFTNRSKGKPTLLQHVSIFPGKPYLVIEAELRAEQGTIGTNHFDVIVSKTPDPGIPEERVLHVPYDNDMWFRFNSIALAGVKPDEMQSSAEVTTIYNNQSRSGVVIGSIAHDTWKTAIDFQAASGHLAMLDVYGGISSPTGVRTATHDTIPHGVVTGASVRSPQILIGYYGDWRDGLEEYGKTNAAVAPPLPWAEGVPAGWNSWAAYGSKINYARYLAAAHFLQDNLLQDGFTDRKIVYVNFDAFWDHLDVAQLRDVVTQINKLGADKGVEFRPGIYWTPFAYWSNDLDAPVEGTDGKYKYRDILLKSPDGNLLPKVDGAYAIDPSHPGSKARAALYIKTFEEMGFRYVKLDFLSHGALEGVHYDPTVQTGTQAYNMGMSDIVRLVNGRMFISLSIAPLFPSGYGNARRLSCDTKGHISGGDQTTEYMLNSLTYGWWTSGNLYIADPDHVVLGPTADEGARSVNEARSRFLSAVISGGMVLDSSPDLDDADARAFSKEVYLNPQLNRIAAEGKVFEPVEGDTGDRGANVFVRSDGNKYYLAVFNFNASAPAHFAIPLARIDAKLANQTVNVVDLSDGGSGQSEEHEISVDLQPAASKMLELQLPGSH